MGPDLSTSRLQKIKTELDRKIRAYLSKRDYAIVIYGSSALCKNALLSNIDLMNLVSNAESSLQRDLEAMFQLDMQEEGALIDAEVSYERRVLDPMQLASKAVNSGTLLDDAGRVLSIRKTSEYLKSEGMLQRLVFDVLTTPNKILSGGGGIITQLEHEAARKLVDMIRTIDQGKVDTTEDFVKFARLDGARSEE
ncbi:hypothetical protein SVAN01_11869 [Stagonosporopsis vannaccii]|nr:hypothetical protein SVAN01_11869 [Stagonosporopsis vannaccii]